MPSELYRERSDGHLVWAWEDDDSSGIDFIDPFEEEVVRIPYKKKIKKCYFCKKVLKDRIYIIKDPVGHIESCSSCNFIYKTLHGENQSQRGDVMRKIYKLVMTQAKHCRLCMYFRQSRLHLCSRDMWTGVGDSHAQDYPLSFANYGCSRYRLNNSL